MSDTPEVIKQIDAVDGKPTIAELEKILADNKDRRVVIAPDGRVSLEGFTEKDRRIYYQNIVYDICNMLDTPERKIVCGTCEYPGDEVQVAVKRLLSPIEEPPTLVEPEPEPPPGPSAEGFVFCEILRREMCAMFIMPWSCEQTCIDFAFTYGAVGYYFHGNSDKIHSMPVMWISKTNGTTWQGIDPRAGAGFVAVHCTHVVFEAQTKKENG